MKKKNKGGRPKIEINWEMFDKLCGIQCTQVEIADWFRCDIQTLQRAVKFKFKIGFDKYYEQKKGKGKISLRRTLFQALQQAATDPRFTTVLIFACKQHLGMVDYPEHPAAKVDLTVKTAPADQPTMRDRLEEAKETIRILVECGAIKASDIIGHPAPDIIHPTLANA